MAEANIVVKILDQTGPGLNRVQNNLDKIEKSTSRVNKGFKSVATAAAGFVTAISGAAILNFIDRIQTLDNRLELVTSSQGELNDRFNQLVAVANKTRAPLEGTVDLYSKLQRATEVTGLNTAETLQVVENFGKALAISGSSGAAAAGAITQFSQAMAGGVLRGEEFNSINEAAPEVLTILARQLGVTRGQLREYAEKGLLNSELVSRALIAATTELNETFGATSVTVGQALTILSNNFQVYGKQVLDSTGAGGILSDVILKIAENLNILVPILTLGAIPAIGALLFAISPVAAAITGAVVAIGALAVAGKEFVSDFNIDTVLISAERAFIQFKIGSLQAIEDFVNGAVSGLSTFKQQSVAVFSGLGEAIMDPLNAFDAFEKGFNESLAKSVEQGAEKFVDFSEVIDASRGELRKLDAQIARNDESQKRLNQSTGDGTDTTNTNKDSTDDNTDAKDANSDATTDLAANNKRLGQLTNELSKQVNKNTNAYAKFTKELEQSAKLARLDSDERKVQQAVYKGLEARAKDLGVEVKDLSETERRQTEKRVRELVELEQANTKYQEVRADVTQEADSIIEQSYRETTTEVQRLERDKQEFIQRAREAGLENDKDVQDAILAYDREIQRERIELNNERIKEFTDAAEAYRESELGAFGVYNQKRQALQEALDSGLQISEQDRIDYLRAANKEYADGIATEYNDLYGLLTDQVQDFTGLTRKEYGILEELTQLTFGVNITDVIKGTFASAIGAVLGFKNEGANNINLFGNSTADTMGGVSSVFSKTFITDGLSAIGSFVSSGFELFSGFAGGVTDLLGSVGSFILNNFSSLFDSITSGASSLISTVSGFFGGGGTGGGIGSTIGSFFGPVGSVVGGIVDFFFADGGRIAPGQFGIVGEAGPELIAGPANITSTADTADMLNNLGGGDVNVNFTINAVDAQGIDSLLLDRRQYITDLVRTAIQERPSTNLRGVV